MKQSLFLSSLVLITASSISYSQVGIGTTSPDVSAALDVKSTNKGLLPPRMTEADRDAITTPATGLTLWCTNCGANGEMQVYNGSVWTNMIGGPASVSPPPPQIGDLRDGGVVFYVASSPTDLDGDGDLDNGLVCAITDQSSSIEWWNGSFTNTGATLTAVGTGSNNTSTIISSQGANQTDYAAGLAKAYSGSGFTDWFLPSKDELNQMYQNMAAIDATAVSNGGSSFASSYWSSTEFGEGLAWIQSFFGTGNQILSNKANTFRVRAVRAF